MLRIVPLLLLCGCSSAITGSTYSDGRFWYSNVKTASDLAGGPRQDALVIVDQATGMVVEHTVAAGQGTLQSLAGVAAATVTAGGQVAGSALVRPTRNNTTAAIEGGSNTTTTNQSTTSNNSNNRQ